MEGSTGLPVEDREATKKEDRKALLWCLILFLIDLLAAIGLIIMLSAIIKTL